MEHVPKTQLPKLRAFNGYAASSHRLDRASKERLDRLEKIIMDKIGVSPNQTVIVRRAIKVYEDYLSDPDLYTWDERQRLIESSEGWEAVLARGTKSTLNPVTDGDF